MARHRQAMALVAGLWLVSGCGVRMPASDPTSPTADGPPPQPASPVAPQITEREAARAVQPGPKAAASLPPAPKEAPTRQAEAKDVELPTYPGATVLRNEATRAQRQSAVVYLATTDSVETVYRWYKQQLVGVKLRDDQLVKDSGSPSATLTVEQADGLRQVTISRQGDQTMVLLVRLRAAGVFKR